MRPHRRQPTRLPRPWDSPGKNTGVGCHFLLQCVQVKSESEVVQSSLILSDPMDCSLPGSSVQGFSRQEYSVACHCFLLRSPGDTVNLQIQTKEVHVGGSPTSQGRSQVLPPAGGRPTCRVYRRGSSVCAGAFVIVLGLLSPFCLCCTRREGGWSWLSSHSFLTTLRTVWTQTYTRRKLPNE